jgi:fructose-1,6-bisphosphatase/sedoheptulose 1,7-bisphosphatase-like protein
MDPGRVFTANDLVSGNQIFFAATGITDSTLLKSVQYFGQKVETHSLLLRSETRTRRFIRMEYVLGEDEFSAS